MIATGAPPELARAILDFVAHEDLPVIGKALVRTDGAPFRALSTRRAEREIGDHYLYPGSIQYFGPPEVCGRPTLTLLFEQGREPAGREPS